MYNPKNPAYVAIRDMGSTKDELDSMLVKLRAAGVSVSLEEMRDAFVARLPGEVKMEMILRGFARLASRTATDRRLQGGLRGGAHDRDRASGRWRVHAARHQGGGPAEEDSRATICVLGDGSRRSNDDSWRGKRGSGSVLNDQFCLTHAARAVGIPARP